MDAARGPALTLPVGRPRLDGAGQHPADGPTTGAGAVPLTCTLTDGGLAERPKAHDWKSCWGNTLTGSNPVSSAT
jgi:hypothetical protein